VQGEEAPAQIVRAIDNANRWQRAGKVALDALIVGRGGGSLEDLWAFNDEGVARAIAASELPVISAVGHEVDFSIADMVADYRAPTPSAAAELISPDQEELLRELQAWREDLGRQMLRRIASQRTGLAHLRQRLRHPGALLREQAQRLDDLEQRLHVALRNQLARRRGELAVLCAQLVGNSPVAALTATGQARAALAARMTAAMNGRLRQYRGRLAELTGRLEALDPTATLARGYAIVRDEHGHVLSNAAAVSPGARVTAQLARGELDLTVEAVREEAGDAAGD
jgi:exodeoxyribonuclease VII large subunit